MPEGERPAYPEEHPDAEPFAHLGRMHRAIAKAISPKLYIGARVSIKLPDERAFGVVTQLTDRAVTIQVGPHRFVTTSIVNPGIVIQEEK